MWSDKQGPLYVMHVDVRRYVYMYACISSLVLCWQRIILYIDLSCAFCPS